MTRSQNPSTSLATPAQALQSYRSRTTVKPRRIQPLVQPTVSDPMTEGPIDNARSLSEDELLISCGDLQSPDNLSFDYFKQLFSVLSQSNQPGFKQRSPILTASCLPSQLLLRFQDNVLIPQPQRIAQYAEFGVVRAIVAAMNKITNKSFDFQLSSVLLNDRLHIFVTTELDVVINEALMSEIVSKLLRGMTTADGLPADHDLLESPFAKSLDIPTGLTMFTPFSECVVKAVHRCTKVEHMKELQVTLKKIKGVGNGILHATLDRQSGVQNRKEILFDPRYIAALGGLSSFENLPLKFDLKRHIDRDVLTLLMPDKIRGLSEKINATIEEFLEMNQLDELYDL